MVWKSASLKIVVITATSRLTRNIRSSWSWMSFMPGKAATPWIISIKMQPTPLEGKSDRIKSSFSNATITALRDIHSSRTARIKNANEIRPPQNSSWNLLMVPSGWLQFRKPIQKVIEDTSQMKTFMRKGFNNLQYNATTWHFTRTRTRTRTGSLHILSGSHCDMELWKT